MMYAQNIMGDAAPVHLPLEGGEPAPDLIRGRPRSGRVGVTAAQQFRRRVCCAAATPPQTAFGSPTLPLQGRV
jgi:hypothetical protein